MSQDLSPLHENAAPKGLQRRQVLKGAAWAAPVVVLTAAVPAASASHGVITAFLTEAVATGAGANRHNIFLNLTSTYVIDQSVTVEWDALPSQLTWEAGPVTGATVAANTSDPAATSMGRIHITGRPGTYTITGTVTLPEGGIVDVSVDVTK
jgi:hypothetical protein